MVTTSNDLVYQEVLYVTTREDTGSNDPRLRYSENRGETAFGAAMVAIDRNKTYGSFAQLQPPHFLSQTEPIGNSKLQQVTKVEKERFMNALAEHDDGRNEILVYIHGYKMGFIKTAAIAAQLRYELAFPGPFIAFSWPSVNTLSGYAADHENMTWSEQAYLDLITELAELYPDSTIHLVAHSLGNKVMLNTLLELKEQYPSTEEWPIGEIVMIAPDIDLGIFERDMAEAFKEMPSRKTLYVSSKDFPLFASATIYKYPRLGDSRNGTPVIEGIDTVDVSDAIPLFDGHGYYEANRETIEDLYHVIRKRLPAEKRPTLTTSNEGGEQHWRLQPVE
jgi:esterase/lipase superfamily enzyme